MAQSCRLGIVSDIHYAGPIDRGRGNDFEYRAIRNPLLRLAVRLHRRFLWLHHPLDQNYLLDRFFDAAGPLDYVVANGDYSCDCDCLGVSEPGAFQSAQECLGKLRQRYGQRLRAGFGDHELGKLSLVERRGGMRLASLRRAREELGLQSFWRLDLGRYTLLGVASSLVALPAYAADLLPEEQRAWEQARAEHLEEVRHAFSGLDPRQRILLFCHDPTALPFLGREEAVQGRLPQIEQTIIGHLHSHLIFWKSRLLSGMPRIGFLGHTVKRLSTALNEARHWRPFKVRLCPALAGIELVKDGGFLTVDLDLDAREPARFQLRRLPR
jgi:hypothetical protein